VRLLADENFPKPVVEALRAEGHDILWARTDHAGARDVVLLDLAEAEARIVLTLDKDFWQIAVQHRSPIGTIRGRSVPSSSGDAREAGTACTCVHDGGYCVGGTYQHHHGRTNSYGRGP
jgi:predicted nuclease of predicted toxin-antitoxin system